MPKLLCKGVKKDGTPCQGQGLEKYGGFCIGHAPKEITDEWRTRGGKNSSNAARSHKPMPEPFDGIFQELRQGLSEVREGKLSPSQFNAMCNGARAMAQLLHLSNQEVDLLRKQEVETAASELAGAPGDLAILKAAAHNAAEYERYTAESLIDQGLAVPATENNHGSTPLSRLVLTDAGRRRFGLQKLTRFTQEDFDQIEALFKRSRVEPEEWVAADQHLSKMCISIEEAIADLESGPAPVRDPLTGHVLTEPPVGVKLGPVNADHHINIEAAITTLKKQRQQVERFIRILEFRYKAELSELRDLRRPKTAADESGEHQTTQEKQEEPDEPKEREQQEE